jgi:hypothetical protein
LVVELCLSKLEDVHKFTGASAIATKYWDNRHAGGNYGRIMVL